MTVLSGISMYALAKLLELVLGWNFHASVLVSAAIVLAYIFLGGLTSAIYNEVLQFFLIVLGFLPLVLLGLRDVGGWSGLSAQLARLPPVRAIRRVPGRSRGGISDPPRRTMGVEWFGLAMGLGFVLSFGYWCTDFLVVQRAMAAESMTAARRTPLLAAVPKMLFPLLVIVPGMIAIALHYHRGGLLPVGADGTPNYSLAVPMLLAHYLPSGLLGLGLTALMASFMSGMAGNVTAFNTVWTYDIYQSYIKPGQSDRHYLRMGHAATVFGILFSVAAAYAATRFNNIMDMLQLVFAFVNALFATFLLGMFWRRATGARRLLRAADRDPGRGRAPWAHAAGGRRAGDQGRLPGRRASTYTRARWPRTSGPRSWRGPPASWQRSSSRWRPGATRRTWLRGLVYSLTPRIRTLSSSGTSGRPHSASPCWPLRWCSTSSSGDTAMKLDLRLPIGLMFSIIGALLVVFGLVSDAAIYQRSLGINVNCGGGWCSSCSGW